MNLHGKTDDCHDKYNMKCKNQENFLVFFNMPNIAALISYHFSRAMDVIYFECMSKF